MAVDRRVTRRPHRAAARPYERFVPAAPGRAASVQPLPAARADAVSGATVDMILRNVHDAIFATDANGVITFWAPSAERLFEYTSAQAVGQLFRELLPGRVALPGSESQLDATVRAGQPWRGEGSISVPSGRDLWLESTINPVVVDGVVTGSVSVSRDMTDAHTFETELAERARLFKSLSEYGAVTNSIHDEEQLSPALIAAIHGVIPAEFIALVLLDLSSGRYYIRATFGGDAAVGAEIPPNVGPSGRAIATRTLFVSERFPRRALPPEVGAVIRHEALTVASVPMVHDGVVLGAITIVRDRRGNPPFSEGEREALTLFGAHAALAIANVRLLGAISELAVHDGLTGLYNRRHFDASLDLLLARWRRARNPAEPVAAIMFDLDRFGKLNRDHGHQSGDAVLRAFGGILHERLRSSDLVARYGGEEFVTVLERTTLAEALVVADAIRISLDSQAIVGPDGTAIHATVSAGVAVLNPAESTAMALLRAADVGLFLAKRGGRNRVAAA